MQWRPSVILAMASAFAQGIQSLAVDQCTSTTTTTILPTGTFNCPLCLVPTTTCAPGQFPTRPPPTTTTSGCTVSIIEPPCPCETCLPGVAKREECSSYTTTTPLRPHCDIVCITPTSICSPGETPGPSISVATVTQDCTVDIYSPICPGCPSCSIATPTPKP
ncbi:hypothetical protein F4778DRAFT_783255 [Xylariomycetidae sp. FL2044]|nr:hypothetical protein F4778DRAFT_783255 [Xylariomycetidae sp. FL2044]